MLGKSAEIFAWDQKNREEGRDVQDSEGVE